MLQLAGSLNHSPRRGKLLISTMKRYLLRGEIQRWYSIFFWLPMSFSQSHTGVLEMLTSQVSSSSRPSQLVKH